MLTSSFPDFIHAWNKEKFQALGGVLAAGSLAGFAAHPVLGITASTFTAGYWYLGLQDLKQTRHTIRRNFPVLGHMRYIFEQLRPEIYQVRLALYNQQQRPCPYIIVLPMARVVF